MQDVDWSLPKCRLTMTSRRFLLLKRFGIPYYIQNELC